MYYDNDPNRFTDLDNERILGMISDSPSEACETDPEVKLAGTPGDYVHGKYAPLTVKNFETQKAFCEYRIAHHEYRKSKIDSDIEELKSEIEALDRFENEEQRELYTKALRAQKRLASLMKDLEEEDIDAGDILDNLQKEIS